MTMRDATREGFTLLEVAVSTAVFALILSTVFSIVVETLAPETYVYASVIESSEHAGRFVAPRIGPAR